jgi:DeoR family glycerol-3-phosphate regulon repressor
MKPKQRQARALEAIERAGEVTVDGLAADFGVSPETVRRDLMLLAENGVVQRVHGGARRLRLHAEGTFEQRMDEAAAEKAKVARKLAQIITPGDTCLIDTGSTTLACAQALSEITDLTIVTNSVRIAQVMARGSGMARVHLIGGIYDVDNGESVGADAIEQIARFHADYAIIGVAALDAAAGPSAANFDEASVARAMCFNARKIIIVAHAEKFVRQAAHKICRFDEIDMIVSDDAPADDLRRVLKSSGVILI